MPGTPDHNFPETILAFDFGLRRIGIAVGQEVSSSASPVTAVRNGEGGPDWQGIGAVIKEWRPTRLVVGLPLHADGSLSEMSGHVRQFVAGLARFEVPVEQVDERYSSLEAREWLKAKRQAGLRGRIDKEAIDSTAAVLIAERWLNRPR
jgi:putative pre-16S rRNA nuclease